MKKEINFNEFVDEFGEDRKNQFSYDGKHALFDYLENYEDETGEVIELDIIALCCEYTEFENVDEYLKNYNSSINKDDYEDEDEYKEAVWNEIQNKTQFIRIYDCKGKKLENFIISNY